MNYPINLLLADDDKDDCLLFKEALEEIPILTNLTVVNDGEQLMLLLTEKMTNLPSVLFLDLNMPRKNGFECLAEIKRNLKLQSIPVIIFSTSFDSEMVNLLYKNGALHYIRKPAEFSNLKETIHNALTIITQRFILNPGKEEYILKN